MLIAHKLLCSSISILVSYWVSVDADTRLVVRISSAKSLFKLWMLTVISASAMSVLLILQRRDETTNIDLWHSSPNMSTTI